MFTLSIKYHHYNTIIDIMDMVDIIDKVKKSSNFWIYTMTSNVYNMYKNYRNDVDSDYSKYISSYIKYDIKSNDIILIYLKNHAHSGFTSVLTVANKPVLNKKNIRIFRDSNLNKYIIELSQVCLINKPISISINKIFNCIKQELLHYKTKNSFFKKHICINEIKKLCFLKNNFKKLLKNIYKLTLENNDKDIKKKK